MARSDPSSGSVYYFFVDQVGSTRIVTQRDSTHEDTVCFEQDYFPYGQEVYTSPGSCAQSYKFTGYERDAETGLDYAFARYYSARLGRFMSADGSFVDQGPTDPQSWNLYAYVRNNPINFVDPTGRGTDCTYEVSINDDPLPGESAFKQTLVCKWTDDDVEDRFRQWQQDYGQWKQAQLDDLGRSPTDQDRLNAVRAAGQQASHDLSCVRNAALGMIPIVGGLFNNPSTPLDGFNTASDVLTGAQLAGSVPVSGSIARGISRVATAGKEMGALTVGEVRGMAKSAGLVARYGPMASKFIGKAGTAGAAVGVAAAALQINACVGR